MTDYTPVDCGLHSAYELSIMQARSLRITWRDRDGRQHSEVLQPRDLVTRDHEEFLVVETPQGQRLEIRLDYITKTEVIGNSRAGL